MEKKTRIALTALLAGAATALVYHLLKSTETKETSAEAKTEENFDDEIEKAFEEPEKAVETKKAGKETELDHSDSNYIVIDMGGKLNKTLSNSFMLNGYRIYTITTGSKLHESFSMPRFLREKSILFITCKEGQTEEALAIARKMKNDASTVYKNAASSGTSSEYRYVTLMDNLI